MPQATESPGRSLQHVATPLHTAALYSGWGEGVLPPLPQGENTGGQAEKNVKLIALNLLGSALRPHEQEVFSQPCNFLCDRRPRFHTGRSRKRDGNTCHGALEWRGKGAG